MKLASPWMGALSLSAVLWLMGGCGGNDAPPATETEAAPAGWLETKAKWQSMTPEEKRAWRDQRRKAKRD